MKKKKIIFTVIKEADGGFSAIGHAGKNNQGLIATQGDTWEELKEMALDAVNVYLDTKDRAAVPQVEVDFSFDLPSFFDTYPHLNPAALAKPTAKKNLTPTTNGSVKKNKSDRQLHRFLAAVKHMGLE